ncbi:adenosine receptor A3-like [Diadema setosum]|uniref:adenosine receptor A3-like n=1 Tax=Diadema setosum TaxID=31175 RepID=UPI003B3B42BB
MALQLPNTSQLPIGHEAADDESVVTPPNYAFFTFSFVLMLVIVIGNSLTIFIFWTTPKLFNQTALCLINLAIADFMTGITFTPFGLPCALRGECLVRSSRAACLTVVILSYSYVGVSGCTLIIVSIDRYLKLSRPLRYHAIFTKRRTITSLVLVWIVVFTSTSSFIMYNPHIITYDVDYYHCGLQPTHEDALAYTYFIDFAFFVCPVGVMTVCSLRIAIIAHRARCQIRSQEAVMDARNPANGIHSRRPVTTDMRVAVRIFVVVFVFIVCFMPYCSELVYARRTSKTFPSKISLAALTMVEMNSAMNPIIYVTTYATFRRALARKLTKLCGRSTRANSLIWTVTSLPPRDRSQSRQNADAVISPSTHSENLKSV